MTECKICKLPLKGGTTGKKLCVCDDENVINRIYASLKERCVDCGKNINNTIELHFIRGNYCGACSAKNSHINKIHTPNANDK